MPTCWRAVASSLKARPRPCCPSLTSAGPISAWTATPADKLICISPKYSSWGSTNGSSAIVMRRCRCSILCHYANGYASLKGVHYTFFMPLLDTPMRQFDCRQTCRSLADALETLREAGYLVDGEQVEIKAKK